MLALWTLFLEMSLPNAGNSGAGNNNPGSQSVDQMGQMFPTGGGNDEWRTETYRNKGYFYKVTIYKARICDKIPERNFTSFKTLCCEVILG